MGAGVLVHPHSKEMSASVTVTNEPSPDISPSKARRRRREKRRGEYHCSTQNEAEDVLLVEVHNFPMQGHETCSPYTDPAGITVWTTVSPKRCHVATLSVFSSHPFILEACTVLPEKGNKQTPLIGPKLLSPDDPLRNFDVSIQTKTSPGDRHFWEARDLLSSLNAFGLSYAA